MKIRKINNSKHNLPAYSTNASAGMVLRANIDGERVCQITIAKHEKAQLLGVETNTETGCGKVGFGYKGNL